MSLTTTITEKTSMTGKKTAAVCGPCSLIIPFIVNMSVQGSNTWSPSSAALRIQFTLLRNVFLTILDHVCSDIVPIFNIRTPNFPPKNT